MLTASCSPGGPYDDEGEGGGDDEDESEGGEDEGGRSKQHRIHVSSSQSSCSSRHEPNSDSGAPSSAPPSPAVGILLDIFTEAMNAVPPSCLRGLALQLPDVRQLTLYCAFISSSLHLFTSSSRHPFFSSSLLPFSLLHITSSPLFLSVSSSLHLSSSFLHPIFISASLLLFVSSSFLLFFSSSLLFVSSPLVLFF